MSNAVISEILNHDSYIGSVLDCAEDIKTMKNSTIKNTEYRLNGLNSRYLTKEKLQAGYKDDVAHAKSAQREEDDWNYFAQRYGLELMPVVHKPSNFVSAESKKPAAKIKKLPTKTGSYSNSYVSANKANEKLVKEFIYRMKLEDVLDIKPSNNPFSAKDDMQLVKVVSFEVRHPYFILTVINAEDEHDRLTDTRSLDETSEIYFTFDYREVYDSKSKRMIENPQVTSLRNWIAPKILHSCVGYQEAVDQLIDRVFMISSEEYLIVDGKKVPNPDFIGYGRYTIDDLQIPFDTDSRDYVGYKTNIHISKRNIEEEKGDIRYVRTNNSIDIYSGDKFLRSYHIFGTEDDK